MICPVNAKEESALQVSRDQTSSFKWLISFSIQIFKKESGWYSLSVCEASLEPRLTWDSRLV